MNRYSIEELLVPWPSCDAPSLKASGELMGCPEGFPCLVTGSIDEAHTAEAGALF